MRTMIRRQGCGMRCGVRMLVTLLALAAAGLAYVATAGEETRPVRTTVEADVVGAYNPDGLLGVAGLTRTRTLAGDSASPLSPYLQTGVSLGSSPAYARSTLHVEWMPVAALQMRVQYNGYRYYGGDGVALLSFPSGSVPFGDDEVDSRKGDAEAAWGQRILFNPVVRVRLGPVILRNSTDLAWFAFTGRGPYFLEWEYDTLLRDNDWLVADSVQALTRLWSGGGDSSLYAGPFFEMARAGASGIIQERAGLVAAWTSPNQLGPLRRPRTFLQAGVHLRDPNRDDSVYVVAGIGFGLGILE